MACNVNSSLDVEPKSLEQSEDHAFAIPKYIVITCPKNTQVCNVLKVQLAFEVASAPVIMAPAI